MDTLYSYGYVIKLSSQRKITKTCALGLRTSEFLYRLTLRIISVGKTFHFFKGSCLKQLKFAHIHLTYLSPTHPLMRQVLTTLCFLSASHAFYYNLAFIPGFFVSCSLQIPLVLMELWLPGCLHSPPVLLPALVYLALYLGAALSFWFRFPRAKNAFKLCPVKSYVLHLPCLFEVVLFIWRIPVLLIPLFLPNSVKFLHGLLGKKLLVFSPPCFQAWTV